MQGGTLCPRAEMEGTACLKTAQLKLWKGEAEPRCWCSVGHLEAEACMSTVPASRASVGVHTSVINSDDRGRLAGGQAKWSGSQGRAGYRRARGESQPAATGTVESLWAINKLLKSYCSTSWMYVLFSFLIEFLKANQTPVMGSLPYGLPSQQCSTRGLR